MRAIAALFALLLAVSGCAGNGGVATQKEDPAGAIYGHGMVPNSTVRVPGTSTTTR
jgi:hypothetical protein